jgi:hypothetical protein
MLEKLVRISKSFLRWDNRSLYQPSGDPVRTGDWNCLSLGAPYRDKVAALGLQLGSATLPGTADEAFSVRTAQARGYFVIRLGLATCVEQG